MFTDDPQPGRKFTKPPTDKTTGPWVVATITGFVTIGSGRPKNATHGDPAANVYDRHRHLYAIYGRPGPLHLARHWHTRQAAKRAAGKFSGIPFRIGTRANVHPDNNRPGTLQKPPTHYSTNTANASPRAYQGVLF